MKPEIDDGDVDEHRRNPFFMPSGFPNRRNADFCDRKNIRA